MDIYLVSGVYGMKPKLLINTGTCFSGTSVLWYTLGLDNHYCHTGHTKEHNYLYHLMTKAEGTVSDPQLHNTTIRLTQEWEKYLVRPKIRKTRNKFMHRYPEMTAESKWIKDKWTLMEKCDFLANSEVSIEKYIKYYLKHWENMKCDFKSVADFSNNNAVLTIPFMKEIKPALEESFDIKVTMIFRDPIRRLWSSINRVCHREQEKTEEHFKYCVSGIMEENTYYSEIHNRWRNVWGKDRVHMIVMEELSAGNVDKLSEFLEYPIERVHENCYYPEMGTKAPHYEGLSDQWLSDKVDLNKETWEYAREHMDPIYKHFKYTFGYIPELWGKWYET